ncbi:MAG: NnrU family protein, partial [Pseudomonadota bacterium]
MKILLLGCCLFLITHALPLHSQLRDSIKARVGTTAYMVLFSLCALMAIALIITGYREASFIPLYDPPLWGRYVLYCIMLVSILLLTVSLRQSILRKFMSFPHIWAIALWGAGHLLV